MKKIFVLSMLIPFAMICSCQKQDSAAERQLAQRKTELDAREQTLDQREKELALRETVLNERERALAEKGKAVANARTTPTPSTLQSRPIPPRDPAQLKAERERVLQQLPPQFQALINPPQVKAAEERNASQVQSQRDMTKQQLLDQRQRRLEELQRTQPQMQNKAAIPATTAAPAAVYPGAEATSPSPSPTPQ